jgi:hypothetical protein
MAYDDRGSYNRAGVEYVMGFCTPAECEESVRSCPEVRTHADPFRFHPRQILVLGQRSEDVRGRALPGRRDFG